MNFILLFFLGGVGANLVFGLGFGVREILLSTRDRAYAITTAVAIFVSSTIGWCAAEYLMDPLGLGFLRPLTLIPLGAGLGALSLHVARMLLGEGASSSVKEGREGIVPFGVLSYGLTYLAVLVADDLLSAFFLISGASLGYLTAALLLWGVASRGVTEEPPRLMAGRPLLLISAGLIGSIVVLIAAFVSLGTPIIP